MCDVTRLYQNVAGVCDVTRLYQNPEKMKKMHAPPIAESDSHRRHERRRRHRSWRPLQPVLGRGGPHGRTCVTAETARRQPSYRHRHHYHYYWAHRLDFFFKLKFILEKKAAKTFLENTKDQSQRPWKIRMDVRT